MHHRSTDQQSQSSPPCPGSVGPKPSLHTFFARSRVFAYYLRHRGPGRWYRLRGVHNRIYLVTHLGYVIYRSLSSFSSFSGICCFHRRQCTIVPLGQLCLQPRQSSQMSCSIDQHRMQPRNNTSRLTRIIHMQGVHAQPPTTLLEQMELSLSARGDRRKSPCRYHQKIPL